MVFQDKIKWRLKLLRIILKKPVSKAFVVFFLIQLLPSKFFLREKINQKYLKKCAESFISPENKKGFEEKILDLKLFKIVAKEANYNSLVWQFLDLVHPYLAETDQVIREGCYEKDEVRLKPGDVVIDAGAYLGLFCLLASKKVGPKGKVYAFEPILENYELLKKTIELNKIDNIEIVPYALGKKEGSLSMSVGSDQFNKSSGFFQTGKNREVKQISLDDFVEQRRISKIDFIKADIEGMERELLAGAEKTIKRFKPSLALCTYHRSDDPRVLEDLIRNFEPEYGIIQTRMKLYGWPDKTKIIGVSLVKNEDLYIERVLGNVMDFCDEIIVLDNMSSDNTFGIVEKMSRQFKKIKLFRVKDVFTSHKFVEKYANTNTWIFPVDGDEIYDSASLKKLKEEILSGKYQDKWLVQGNGLNCEEINLNSKTARGYLSPPSRLVPRLYNFFLLKSWTEKYSQRLHGTNLVFKRGYDKFLIYKISDYCDWDSSYFRALHLCFLKRTSLNNKYKNTTRLSPEEASRFFPIIRNFISNLFKKRITFASAYKLKKYKEGKLATKNIQPFFL